MGLNCAPQLANAYGYIVEVEWVCTTRPQLMMATRFIDDVFVAGPHAGMPALGLPDEAQYGMGYKLTSEGPSSLIYLSIRVFVDERGHESTLHDRAVD